MLVKTLMVPRGCILMASVTMRLSFVDLKETSVKESEKTNPGSIKSASRKEGRKENDSPVRLM